MVRQKARLMTKWTNFGFESVSPGEKTRRVRDVFNRVAQKYDVMNDLMSCGIHRLWKDWFVQELPVKNGMKILDVAGGTGDIPLKLLKTYPHLDLHVTVCDLTPNMIEVGRDRAINQGVVHSIDWVCGNAESLPLPDESVDLYTIVFGLRNVTHIDKALQEALRVLKPGGTFVCLEFSKVAFPPLASLYDTYSFTFLPWLGEVVAQDREAYQYLVESIRRFPDQETLGALLKEVGFSSIHWQNWLGGVSCVHKAIK